MLTFHYIREHEQVFVDTPLLDSVKIKHDGNSFDSATYKKCGEETIAIRNCEGSLILIDFLRRGLNKLHIGELLMRNPHAEVFSSRGEGPRIDLNRIDLKYAQERLEELKRWKDEGYRELLRQRYDQLSWYSIPHRLNQLDTSPQQLKVKIKNMERLIGYLEQQPSSTFVSDNAREIESRYNKLRGIFESTAEFFKPRRTKRDRRHRKIALSSEIVDSIEGLSRLIKRIFNYAEHHANFDPNRAANYWEKVDAWGECRINDHLFTRYDAVFWHHLRRHFLQDKTVGSKFTLFASPRAAVDFAWGQLQERGYNGERTIIELDPPHPVGVEGIVTLSDLPAGTRVEREKRDGIHEVNVAYGVYKKPTNHLVIIVEPLESGRHGFTTMYPGKICPDIDEDPEFWDRHAFLA